MKNLFVMMVIACCLSAGMVQADDTVEQKLKNRLGQVLPGRTPDSVNQTPIPGIYEVVFGAQVVYMTADAKYLFQGEILDLDTRQSLTDVTKTGVRKEVMSTLSDDETIIFAPKGQIKHSVTIFTDIDCPYCRKLHDEMAAYNEAGILVRYTLYPRAGRDTPSYNKAVSVWCAKDRQMAMNDAKGGKDVPSATCENPVDKHMDIAGQIGVRGTPAIVTQDGMVLPGYRPANELVQVLDQLAASE